MEPIPLQSTAMPVSNSIPALSPEERRQLDFWTEAARRVGIDGVEDLGSRPWPVEAGAVILGIYRAGESFASWLVVGRDGDWSVASCADSTVIGSGRTLSEALATLYRTGEERALVC